MDWNISRIKKLTSGQDIFDLYKSVLENYQYIKWAYIVYRPITKA